MRRRLFLKLMGGGLLVTAYGTIVGGCVGKLPDDGTGDDSDADPNAPRADAAPGTPDAGGPSSGGPDASAGTSCDDVPKTTMYDTYAQALYLDGSLGPLTGVIEVEYVLAGVAITLDFWHGHGGQLHRFTLTPEAIEQLKQGMRVYLPTTEVEDHSHMLFIDPTDPEYRVEGATPVEVPLLPCT